ncbi:MAG: hypothetical protein JST68_17770 [Bacteroidetes bacterium]|nr:hypothetical protein [Bacteroidota bacterium]
MKAISTIRNIYVFLLLGMVFNFFSPKVLEGSGFSVLRYAYVLSAIVISLPYLFRKQEGLAAIIKWLFFFQMLAVLVSYYSWDQGILQGLQASIYLSLWPFLLYLQAKRYPLENIERIVLAYGVLYILLFTYQYFHSDTPFFGSDDEFREERGVTRIMFDGGGTLFLSAFICVNKLTEKVRFKLLYGLFVLAALTITVLQVTRQNIIVLLFFCVLHLLRKVSLFKKVLVMGAVGAAIVLFLNSGSEISEGLITSQEETVSAGENYSRVLSGSYFLNEFSPNWLSRIFGNGAPYKSSTDASAYGDAIYGLKESNSYYLSDVGIIGFYVMFGIFAVAAYLLLFVKGLRVDVPERYQYLKYYVWYILLTSLTSDGVYGTSFLLTNVFAFYGLQLYYRHKPATVKAAYPIHQLSHE